MNKIEQLANLKMGFTKGFITEKEYKEMQQKIFQKNQKIFRKPTN
tara:strand:+ start:452 stop:586 length:135 start_codon:yes stop_codon:yes gene_type:complete